MADCPNGEYFSVTLQQCMAGDAFTTYLRSLRDRFNQGDGRAAMLLKQEQAAFGDDQAFRQLADFGNVTAGTPAEKVLNLLTGSAIKILVIAIGVLLVALAVNAWLNERGAGVDLPKPGKIKLSR